MRKADVVFVHGLGGDAFGTWRHGEDDTTSWPHWVGQEFPDVGVWSLGYAASPSRWAKVLRFFGFGSRDSGHGMALPARALQVLDLMIQQGLGQRPLLFVCHSLGGLVAKQILRTSYDAVSPEMAGVFTNTRAVLFLSTPHAGSTLASVADHFRTIFAATVTVEGMRAHDAHLADLYNWYRNHAGSIRTDTYFETRPVVGLTVVNPTSAHPGVGADPVPLDEDHISIAKPRDREAQVCGAARRLLRDHVLAPRSIPPAHRASPAPMPPAPAARRLPLELPPAAENFFGRSAQLAKLTERLRAGKNTAVVGPAGLGKTALAGQAVRAVVGDTPATLAAAPFPHGVVLLDLYACRGQAEPAWNTLAEKLAGAEFKPSSPARVRAQEACRGRRILVIIEGGEEADGGKDRAAIDDLLSVLSPENRRLLLTRLSSQTVPSETVSLTEALEPGDAAELLDSLTEKCVTAAVRGRVLELLQGHPLAITWAGNLLARRDEPPERLVADWNEEGAMNLTDPIRAVHTLRWLFDRSVRGLDDAAGQALQAAGLLARAPFPLPAVVAALGKPAPANEQAARAGLKSLVQRGLLRLSAGAERWEFTHVLGYRFARRETGSDPALLARLGDWLHKQLEAALAAAGGAEAPSLGNLLEHAAAVLRGDDDQRLWPLASYARCGASDRLSDLGRLDLVKLALSAAAGWMERFPPAKAQEAAWRRERAAGLDRMGNVLLVQGDSAGALAASNSALSIAKDLAAADPFNTLWQRDLSVSHNRVGDVQLYRGDLVGALASHRASLTIEGQLTARDPSNAGGQRDLALSHNKVGTVLEAQGALPEALAAYREALAIAGRLPAADTSTAEWQQTLSVSQQGIGDVLSAQNDLAGALAAYRAALVIARRLAENHSSNLIHQRNLAVILGNVSEVLTDQGALTEATAGRQEALPIAERLAAADSSNTVWQRDFVVALLKLGSLHLLEGRLDAALACAERALPIAERLAALDPTNAQWQTDAEICRKMVAMLGAAGA